jgi:peptide chain release factor 2
VDNKLIQLEEEEQKTQDPNFWDNPKEAEKQLKVVRNIKVWTDSYFSVSAIIEDLQVLFDFYKEGDVTEEEMDEQYEKVLQKVEDLEFKNMLSAEEDSLSAVLQITAGAGGTESCDWSSMLYRMYNMWAEKNGYKTVMLLELKQLP